MKSITLSLLLIFCITLANGQAIVQPGDTKASIPTIASSTSAAGISSVPCTPPLGSDTILGTCDSGMVQISVQTSYCANWYTTGTGGAPISTVTSLQTGMIYDDSTFYVENVCPDTAILAPLGAHSSVYTGSHWARGYWFTAPRDFYISGLRVPTEAATSAQTVEVIRFAASPAIYPATTNGFTSLGRFVNVPGSAMIPTCIHVQNGDMIAIFGVRGDTNSYHNSSFNSNIAGSAVTLYRTLMQDTLSTQPLHDVGSFTSASSISRTEMYYSLTTDTSNRISMNVTVPQSFNDTIFQTICQGDSLLFGGQYLQSGGVFTDSLQTSEGCDSIPILDLTVTPCAGYDENYFGNQIQYYPNPVAGSLTVRIANTNAGAVSMTVSDLTGKIVLRKENVKSGNQSLDLPAGMYTIIFTNYEQSHSGKLIVK